MLWTSIKYSLICCAFPISPMAHPEFVSDWHAEGIPLSTGNECPKKKVDACASATANQLEEFFFDTTPERSAA